MATKTIAWESGSGYITLTYTGVGNAHISVESDANDLFEDRQQTVQIVTTEGSPQKAVELLIKQKAKSYDVGQTFDFGYTGEIQQITLPKGKYKLQCWGAQGGSVSGSYTATGSRGGYSEGILTVTEATTIYVFVGGQGTDSSTSLTSGTANGGWNGGGASVRYSSYSSGGTSGYSYPRPGGGATDMCLVTSTMSYSSGRTVRQSDSLLSRFIVAGGGAGASATYRSETSDDYETTTTVYNGYPSWVLDTATTGQYYAANIKFTAYAGSTYSVSTVGTYYDIYYIGFDNNVEVTTTNSNASVHLGRTISQGNTSDVKVTITRTYTVSGSTSTFSNKSNSAQQGGGKSGKGQYPGTQSSAGSGGDFGLGANQTTTNYRHVSGAGGGGWYGGGTGHSDTGTGYVNYSGGGSGFVNTAANAGYRPSGYTGLQLDSGSTQDGSTSFASPSGGNETGHSGNGYARITVLE